MTELDDVESEWHQLQRWMPHLRQPMRVGYTVMCFNPYVAPAMVTEAEKVFYGPFPDEQSAREFGDAQIWPTYRVYPIHMTEDCNE